MSTAMFSYDLNNPGDAKDVIDSARAYKEKVRTYKDLKQDSTKSLLLQLHLCIMDSPEYNAFREETLRMEIGAYKSIIQSSSEQALEYKQKARRLEGRVQCGWNDANNRPCEALLRAEIKYISSHMEHAHPIPPTGKIDCRKGNCSNHMGNGFPVDNNVFLHHLCSHHYRRKCAVTDCKEPLFDILPLIQRHYRENHDGELPPLRNDELDLIVLNQFRVDEEI